MQQLSRQRLKFWLRAEKALGLTHVPASREEMLAPPPAEETPVPPTTQQAVAPQAAAPRAAVPVARAAPPAAAAPPAKAAGPSLYPSLPSTNLAIPEPPAFGPELSASEKATALALLDESHVRGCTKCALCRTRRNTVFGEGDSSARIMFVGEGPGGTEDAMGRPFVGRAGQKLDEMIKAMGFAREQVYICNVVKCRAYLLGPPPKDRPPQPEEAAACIPYLYRQIDVVRPRAIVTLGLSAMQYLLGVKQSMSRMRGNWQSWQGIPVMPTFHPSYILRNPTVETRRAVWEDLKQVMAKLKSEP